MRTKIISYECQAITITYDVARCTHFEACVDGLPDVFHRDQRPWVTPVGALPDDIAEVILRCPTGALHFVRHDGAAQEPVPAENHIEVRREGPLFVRGDVEILTHGREILLKDTRIALCRCGASQNKPLCDNAHLESGYAERGLLPEACGQPMPADNPT